jgi:hypothetical protein
VFTLSDEKQNNLDNPWLDFLANLIFSSEDMILSTVPTIENLNIKHATCTAWTLHALDHFTCLSPNTVF